MATRYLDLENGNDANDATSYANRVKTFAGLASKVAAGDTVRIMGSPAPTALGSCTWTNGSRSLTIPSGVVKDVDTCDAAWTGATNVTATTTTTRKQGTNANSLAIAAAFTTGQVAFKALGSAQDFSAYQQLNLWIQANATLSSGVLRVDLCSDTAGATPVDSFTINVAINPINTWHSIVIDKGSALGSSIQSVAITALSDPGTVTIIVDNIFVSKGPSAADCLTLHSAVRKTTPGEYDFWSNIVSASGTAVELGAGWGQSIGNSRTYAGTTETVATQVRQAIMQTPVTTSTTVIAANGLAAVDGTNDATRLSYSGGWDRTNMSTQDSETWLGVCNGMGIGFLPTSRKYLSFSKLGFIGFQTGIGFGGGNWINWTDCTVVGAANNAIECNSNTQGKGHTFLRCVASHCFNNGFRILGGNPGMHKFIDCTVYGAANTAITSACWDVNGSGDTLVRGCKAYNGGSWGFQWSPADPLTITYDGCTTNFNASGAGRANGGCDIFTRGCNFQESVVGQGASNGLNWRLVCNRFAGGADDHRIYMYLATMTTETGANRRTAAGYAYKVLLSGSRTDQEDAVLVPLGRFFVRAGQTFTYTLYVNRSATGLGARLRIPIGGYDANHSSDVTAAASGAAGAYEQLSVTITPAADIEMPVYLEVTGSNTQFVYFDDSSQSWSG